MPGTQQMFVTSHRACPSSPWSVPSEHHTLPASIVEPLASWFAPRGGPAMNTLLSNVCLLIHCKMAWWFVKWKQTQDHVNGRRRPLGAQVPASLLSLWCAPQVGGMTLPLSGAQNALSMLTSATAPKWGVVAGKE